MMHIDSYKFGEIVIDGLTYRSDLIILSGTVRPNWWRKQGHLLSPEDIENIVEAEPAILIIGCGASGLMKVSEQTRLLLQQNNIKLEESDTHKAVRRFNELSQEGTNVAAALHLTC